MLRRPYQAGVVAACFLLNLLLLWLYFAGPRIERDIAPEDIRPERGLAFIFGVPRARFPFALADDSGSQNGSRLVVLENGAPLSVPHAPHSDIRKQGHGRYSHWNGEVYFSSSDGSDPRSNGARYALIAPLGPASALVILAATVDVGLLWLYRRPLKHLVVAKPWYVSYAAAAFLIGLAVAAASGAFPPEGAPSTDAAVVWRAALHAFGGSLLALLQWCAGAGLARLLFRERKPDFAVLGLLGVPMGMAITTLGAAIALAVPAASLLVLALLAACLVSCLLFHSVEYRQQLLDLARAVPALILFSASFGAWLALHWHGPTDTLPGFASGDLTYYASMLWALDRTPYSNAYLPFEGITHNYWNLRLPAIGAAFLRYLPADGFLFIAGAVPAMGLMGMALALKAYCSAIRLSALPLGAVALIALAFAAAGRYPYWLAESPPVADLGALTIAVWFYVRRSEIRPALAPAAFVLSVAGAALSKVVATPALGGLTLVTFLRASVKTHPELRKAVAALALAGLAFAAYMLYRFLPFYLARAPLGPESFDLVFRWKQPLALAWPFVARDIGTLALAFLAFRIVTCDKAIVLALACVATLGYAFLLRANFACVLIVFGLIYLESARALERTLWHAILVIVLSLPAMVLTDPSGVPTGLIWTLTIVMLCIFALPLPERERGLVTMPLWSGWTFAAMLLAFGAARGAVDFSDQFAPGSPELTPDIRRLWATVRTLTPVGAIVFTDQTGEDSRLLGGWNTYVMHGQRQVFVSDVTQDGMLYTRPGFARDRLRINASVLDGTTPPTAAGLSGSYSQYYAAASKDRAVGPQWQRVRDIGRWALYVWRDEAPTRSRKTQR